MKGSSRCCSLSRIVTKFYHNPVTSKNIFNKKTFDIVPLIKIVLFIYRLQFLDLQLELLDEFRVRLLQLARQDKFQELFVSKSSPNISPILNTLAAIVNVLDDWADLPVQFINLYLLSLLILNNILLSF